MMNAGIIGISGFGSVHYNDLMRMHRRGDLALVCATVINQEEEAEKCRALQAIGCRLYTDYQEMLRDFAGKLNLCCIPTGINFHAPMAAAAMRSGCDVFMEKPATAVIEELEELQRVEKETGRKAFVGFQHIYQPEIQRIKREILNGRLGKLRKIFCVGYWPRNRRYYARNRWAARIRLGDSWVLDSPANNALAHYLNLSCYLAGLKFYETAEIQALEAQLYRTNPEIENFDTSLLHLNCAGGAEIFYYVTHSSRKNEGPMIRVCCENGTAEWSAEETVFQYENGEMDSMRNAQDVAMRENIFSAVLDHLRRPDSVRQVCGLDIARAHTLAVNAAQTAAPVIPVNSDEVEKIELEDGNYRYVWKAVDAMLDRLYREGGMPSQADSRSVVAASAIELADYHRFSLNPGTKLRQ